MRDVAARAGVSVITVSRALREPAKVAEGTRERILSAVAAMGYVPNLVAGSLKSRRSGFVAGIIPSVAHSIASEVTRGMNASLRVDGLRLMLADSGFSPEEEQELVAGLLARRPDALYLTGVTHTAVTRQLLKASRIPVVETGNLSPCPIDMMVGFSNFGAAHAITAAITASGRRRIGYVAQAGRAYIDRLQDRFDGHRRALEDAGLQIEDRRVVETEFSYAGGAEGLAVLLAREPDLDAVVCSSDVLALGVLFECLRRRIAVPGRIAIGGIDDSELSAQCVPRLSTVRVPRFEIGRVAGEMICRRLRGETVADPVADLGFELVMRETI
jgi:LacI family gluconate utilization system Gnt-I transcriptional repressor